MKNKNWRIGLLLLLVGFLAGTLFLSLVMRHPPRTRAPIVVEVQAAGGEGGDWYGCDAGGEGGAYPEESGPTAEDLRDAIAALMYLNERLTAGAERPFLKLVGVCGKAVSVLEIEVAPDAAPGERRFACHEIARDRANDDLAKKHCDAFQQASREQGFFERDEDARKEFADTFVVSRVLPDWGETSRKFCHYDGQINEDNFPKSFTTL